MSTIDCVTNSIGKSNYKEGKQCKNTKLLTRKMKCQKRKTNFYLGTSGKPVENEDAGERKGGGENKSGIHGK